MKVDMDSLTKKAAGKMVDAAKMKKMKGPKGPKMPAKC